jgi:hypothetical protein
MRGFHERRWKLKSTFIVDLIMAANGAAANEKWKMESEANENRLRQQLRSRGQTTNPLTNDAAGGMMRFSEK